MQNRDCASIASRQGVPIGYYQGLTPPTAWPNGMPEVGQIARRTRNVTERDIELFTEMSSDRNPLHYDEATARATSFGRLRTPRRWR